MTARTFSQGIIFLVFLFSFVFPSKIFGAIYLSSVSGTTINSCDDEITIFATASGLTSSPQYLQAVFTKKDDTTNYFGLTQNLSGEWYSYKSSPALTDLQNYFYKLDFSGATWSGQLKTKIDTSDDGFKGPGIYLLKLYKHVTGSGTISNNFQEITINVASVAAQTTNSNSSDTTSVPDPAISWTLPGTGNLGESFKTTYSLTNFAASTEYYVKVRGAQTKNGSNYLSENESWTGFPVIKIKDNGTFDGEIYALVADEKDAGDFSCKLRFRKKDSDSFVESEAKTITMAKKEVVAVTKPATVSAAKVASSSAWKPLVLGTKSGALKTTNKPPVVSEVKKSQNFWPVALMVVGLIFLAAPFVSIARKWYNNRAL